MAQKAEILELDAPAAGPLVKRLKTGRVSSVVIKTRAQEVFVGGLAKAPVRSMFMVPREKGDPVAAAKVLEAAMVLTRKLGAAEVMKRLAVSVRSRRLDPSMPSPVTKPFSTRPSDNGHGEAERWLKMRSKFLEEYRSVTAPELAIFTASKAKNQSARAHDWVKAGRIFSVNDGAAERYPTFQIREGQPIPQLAEILKVLSGKLSSWQIAFWFTSPNAWTGSWRMPADILASEPGKVLEAARHEVAVQAF